MLHEESDELVTEEDFLRLEQLSNNKLLRHAKQADQCHIIHTK